jgi:hypothetical protein
MIVRVVVGEKEKHSVELDTAGWKGSKKLYIDGELKSESVDFGPMGTVGFTVGDAEKHEVEMRVSFGFRGPSLEVFVDGVPSTYRVVRE